MRPCLRSGWWQRSRPGQAAARRCSGSTSTAQPRSWAVLQPPAPASSRPLDVVGVSVSAAQAHADAADDAAAPSTSAPSVPQQGAYAVRASEAATTSGRGNPNDSSSSGRPGRLPGTSAAEAEGRRIMAQIKGCSNWYQMRLLAATNAASLNSLHAAALLSRIVATVYLPLQAREASELSHFLDTQLLPIVARCMTDMGPRELATVSHALATLGHVPQPAWTRLLLDHASRHLSICSPRELSTLVWALGALHAAGERAGEGELGGSPTASASASAITSASQRSMGGAGMMQEQLWSGAQRQQSYAAGSPRSSPSSTALQQQRQRQERGSAQAAGARQLSVPAWFLTDAETASLSSLHWFNCQDLSTLAVGFARLGHRPSGEWSDAYLARVQAMLRMSNPQAMSNILHSLDRMGVQPSAPWLSAFAAASLPQLRASSGQALALLAGAMSRLAPAASVVAGVVAGDSLQGLVSDQDPLQQQQRQRQRPTQRQQVAPQHPQLGQGQQQQQQQRQQGHQQQDQQQRGVIRAWTHQLLLETQQRMADARQVPGGPLSNAGRGRAGKGSRLLGPEDLVCLALALPGLVSQLCAGSGGSVGGDSGWARGSGNAGSGNGCLPDGHDAGVTDDGGGAGHGAGAAQTDAAGAHYYSSAGVGGSTSTSNSSSSNATPVDHGAHPLVMPHLDSDAASELLRCWVGELQSSMLQQMQAFTPCQLSNALMALARIHQGAWQASRQQHQQHLQQQQQWLQLGRAGVAAAVEALDSESSTGAHPTAAAPVPTLFLEATGVQGDGVRLPGAWAAPLATLPRLSAAWLRAWLQLAARHGGAFNAADTAQALWALATLQRCYGAGRGAGMVGSAASIGGLPSRQVPLQHQQAAQHHHHQQQAVQQQQQQQGVQGEGATGVAPMGLGTPGLPQRATSAPSLQLPSSWLDHFLQCTRGELVRMSPSQLSLTAWSLAALGHNPGWQWGLVIFEASARAMAGSEQAAPEGAAGVSGNSLNGQYGSQQPSQQQQQEEGQQQHQHQHQQQGQFESQQRQGEAQQQQHQQQRRRLEGQERREGPQGQGQARAAGQLWHGEDLSVLLMALGHLQLKPLQAWREAAVGVLLQQLSSGQLQGRRLALALWGAYRLRLALGATAATAMLQGVTAQAHTVHMGPESAALMAWSVAGLWLNSRAVRGGGGAGGAAAVVRGVQRRGQRRRRRQLLLLQGQSQQQLAPQRRQQQQLGTTSWSDMQAADSLQQGLQFLPEAAVSSSAAASALGVGATQGRSPLQAAATPRRRLWQQQQQMGSSSGYLGVGSRPASQIQLERSSLHPLRSVSVSTAVVEGLSMRSDELGGTPMPHAVAVTLGSGSSLEAAVLDSWQAAGSVGVGAAAGARGGAAGAGELLQRPVKRLVSHRLQHQSQHQSQHQLQPLAPPTAATPASQPLRLQLRVNSPGLVLPATLQRCKSTQHAAQRQQSAALLRRCIAQLLSQGLASMPQQRTRPCPAPVSAFSPSPSSGQVPGHASAPAAAAGAAATAAMPPGAELGAAARNPSTQLLSPRALTMSLAACAMPGASDAVLPPPAWMTAALQSAQALAQAVAGEGGRPGAAADSQQGGGRREAPAGRGQGQALRERALLSVLCSLRKLHAAAERRAAGRQASAQRPRGLRGELKRPSDRATTASSTTTSSTTGSTLASSPGRRGVTGAQAHGSLRGWAGLDARWALAMCRAGAQLLPSLQPQQTVALVSSLAQLCAHLLPHADSSCGGTAASASGNSAEAQAQGQGQASVAVAEAESEVRLLAGELQAALQGLLVAAVAHARGLAGSRGEVLQEHLVRRQRAQAQAQAHLQAQAAQAGLQLDPRAQARARMQAGVQQEQGQQQGQQQGASPPYFASAQAASGARVAAAGLSNTAVAPVAGATALPVAVKARRGPKAKLQLPPALLPVHTAALAASVVRLRAHLPEPERRWLLLQMEGALRCMPVGSAVHTKYSTVHAQLLRLLDLPAGGPRP